MHVLRRSSLLRRLKANECLRPDKLAQGAVKACVAPVTRPQMENNARQGESLIHRRWYGGGHRSEGADALRYFTNLRIPSSRITCVHDARMCARCAGVIARWARARV